MPISIHFGLSGADPLLAWGILLFALLPFLFLLFLRGCLRALRPRWPGRCGRRRALLLLLLLLALGRRRRLRPWGRRLVPVRLGTIVGLCRGRAVVVRPIIGLIGLGTIVGLSRGRAVVVRPIIGLIGLGTIVGLSRGRAVVVRPIIGLCRSRLVGLS